MELRPSSTATAWGASFGRAATPQDFGIEWNAENQLVRVTRDGSEVARFAYDPMGRRVEKGLGTSTAYTYAREDILREAAGGTSVRYVHGPGIDEPVAVESAGGQLLYQHADALGSELKRTDASGSVGATRSYEVFGALGAGAAVPGYAFTGREWDAETSLYSYRARYYDPGPGRFLSEDPIRFRGGINFFAYSRNQPALLVDPFGLESGNINRQVPGPGKTPMYPWPKNAPEIPDQGGCGSGPTEYLVPDAFIVDFQPACVVHDRCYESCGTGKRACDFQFYDNLKKACDHAPKGLRTVCKAMASVYLAGVNYGGGGPYTQAQGACNPCTQERPDDWGNTQTCSGGICIMTFEGF